TDPSTSLVWDVEPNVVKLYGACVVVRSHPEQVPGRGVTLDVRATHDGRPMPFGCAQEQALVVGGRRQTVDAQLFDVPVGLDHIRVVVGEVFLVSGVEPDDRDVLELHYGLRVAYLNALGDVFATQVQAFYVDRARRVSQDQTPTAGDSGLVLVRDGDLAAHDHDVAAPDDSQ